MIDIDGILIEVGGISIFIHQTILVWLILCVFLCIFFYFIGKRLQKADASVAPKGFLLVVEEIVGLSKMVVGDNLQEKTQQYLPFLGTCMLLMVISNLLGLIGLQTPTSNLGLATTLSVMMFVLIQGSGIKKKRLLPRLKEWLDPHPLLSPLNVIGDMVLPLSLSLRLFGNLLGGTIITALLYAGIKGLMSVLLPLGSVFMLVTPFFQMYFDIFSGVMQTYIFFMLSSFFLSQQVLDEE